jgi:2-dehydropantoate 2-reductase
VLAVPELHALVREAMHEVAAVARAEGVVIEQRTIDRMLDVTRSDLGQSVPSMLQDVLAGRPTEVRSLQGAVVERGAHHGIATPVHDTLQALVLGLETRTLP